MKRRLFLMSIPGGAGCLSRTARLNVFNWSNYIGDTTLAQFEKETGIQVRYQVYESNEEMLARVMSGNSGWDVVFPSNYFIQPMREMGLLAPVDPSRLSNLGALDDMFRKPSWDPKLEWCVPYMWGSSGILYRREIWPPPARWADLWGSRFRGRITMLDDPAEVFAASLKKIGYSINATAPPQLEAAKQQALAQKPILRAYLNAEVRDQMVAGDLAACQLWATTAQQAMDAAANLRFAHPLEGYPLYADCAAVLRESPRQREALRFINFLLRPEIAASIVRVSRTATANGEARALLPVEVRDLQSLYPSGETLARGEWFATLPSAAQRLRDRFWTEVKAS